MQVETFAIDGPLLLTPRLFGDGRGFFFESWNENVFAEALGVEPEKAPVFRQDNQSNSCRGVLRGLHYQLEPEPQGKLVRCVAGEIFDVAVDIRRSSPTFGQWVGARLSGTNHRQLWVPVGFAHGFLTLSDTADVLYKASGFWNRTCERSIRWDDPGFAIDWPLAELGDQEVLLAEKDAAAPTFAEALAQGDVFQ
jgi:dTDP-4-dehydrorhamnose 3,5-epimerase